MPTKSVPASAPLVLLIDDTEDDREVYVTFLQFHGLRTATASDGEDGLNKVADLKPDAIVLDLRLPVVDGFEVARRLKGSRETTAIPLIALTAEVTEQTRERAFTAGVDDFCVKPCSPPDLMDVIRQHLARTEPKG